MQATLVWTILLSRDVESAMAFYGEAVGWTFEPFPGTPYPSWLVTNIEGSAAAALVDTSRSDFPDAPELWLPYFKVCGLDGRVSEAERLGATVLRPPFEIPGFGRVAILRQPGGAIVGWMSPPANETLGRAIGG